MQLPKVTKCPVYFRDFVGDFWTSGMKKGIEFVWSARQKAFDASGTKWNSGEPSAKGECVYVQLVNSTENSFLATDNCAENKKFICEVRKL